MNGDVSKEIKTLIELSLSDAPKQIKEKHCPTEMVRVLEVVARVFPLDSIDMKEVARIEKKQQSATNRVFAHHITIIHYSITIQRVRLQE